MKDEKDNTALKIIGIVIAIFVIAVIVFLTSLSSHLKNAPKKHMKEFFENEYMNHDYKGKLTEFEYVGSNNSAAEIKIQLKDSSIVIYHFDIEPNPDFISNVKLNDSIIKTKGNDTLLIISKKDGLSKKIKFIPYKGMIEPPAHKE